ncbi:ATP-dependent Clp protease adaptor ClpS [Pajaroellobacter abortibovis]|uniref:ATP-dependent Clp protease adapter protein ClpS n=1 Tax=Pajaroellobacter abortibovis TaxID=1882918 RepID=A0A1L6MZI5_9BACT|nr:ATP-dependent Clp protease adaptor ClpS [Pajaroellobacter abortibovis]APS00910.1 hypothetical protein BCY86_05630 [Pajaroellobacter abortibovis]
MPTSSFFPFNQESETEQETTSDTKQELRSPRKYKVIIHNDDFTTMKFVIDILRQFFHKTETEAVHIMLTVHKKGKDVAGIFIRDIAETKIADVTRYAREHSMPLLLTAEPEEQHDEDKSRS